MIRALPRDLRAGGVVAPLLAAVLFAVQPVDAQSLSYTRGQSVSPAYEGWEETDDGQRYFLFGYMNRNWDEELDIPVGPNNSFSPGPADQGQPTHFLPRRNRFTFKVPVPDGFTEDDEMVWTLTSGGESIDAFASLRPDYFIDNVVIMSETGALGAGTSSPEVRANIPPSVTLQTSRTIEARVHEPVELVAIVTDDGVPATRGARGSDDEDDDEEDEEEAAGEGDDTPEATPEQQLLQRLLNPPRRVTVGKVNGLHFAWFVYRGSGEVTFDPIQVQTWENTRVHGNSPWATAWRPPPIPEDNRWVVHATFHEPGTYVLQGRADDGGLYTDERITVNVRE